MESMTATIISWCAFLGAWLLVAGPVYQAALELREHELAGDRIAAVARSIPRPPEVSAWWLLLPPVKVVLERRRALAFQRAYVSALAFDDYASLLSFLNKATGWLLVAGGGLLLAAKETYQLAREHHWSALVFGLLTLAMFAACLLMAVARVFATDRALRKKRGAGAPTAT